MAGAGSGASHLVTGHGREHQRLEEELAAFTGRERALLFSTGYMANLAVMTCLAGRGERVVLDRLCHASLIDGARLSGATLQALCARGCGAPRSRCSAPVTTAAALLATDGVFSMDGDLAPLPAAGRRPPRAAAGLAGRGRRARPGRARARAAAARSSTSGWMRSAVPVLVGTLGKAFGSFGAFVAGDAALVEFLMQTARTYIYTTALPQPVAAATRAALALVTRESWRRERVRGAHRALSRRARCAAGVPLMASATPIQPVLLGSAAARAAPRRRSWQRPASWSSPSARPPCRPAARACASRCRRRTPRRRSMRWWTHSRSPVRGARGARVSALHVKISGRGRTWCCCTAGRRTSGVWKELTRALSHKFRIISLDLPGHGKSDWDPTRRHPGRADLARARDPGADHRALLAASAGHSAASSRSIWPPRCRGPSRTWCW